MQEKFFIKTLLALEFLEKKLFSQKTGLGTAAQISKILIAYLRISDYFFVSKISRVISKNKIEQFLNSQLNLEVKNILENKDFKVAEFEISTKESVISSSEN